jgi:hypothetical protein
VDYESDKQISLIQRRENEKNKEIKAKNDRLEEFLGVEKTARRGSLQGVWDKVLTSSIKMESDKLNNQKNLTIAGFRVEETSGIVKRRIGISIYLSIHLSIYLSICLYI